MQSAIGSTVPRLVVAMAACLVTTSATAAASVLGNQPIEGTWTATQRDAGRFQLSLHWSSNTMGKPIARSELRGLSDAEIASATSNPVSFRIERDPGLFELDGVFRDGRGAGHFSFHPNYEFGSTLRSLGIAGADQVTDSQLIILALANTSAAYVREMTGLGLGSLHLKDVIELAVHGITPDFARSVRSLGVLDTLTVRGIVDMKIHRITPEYVRALEALGYRGLSRRELMDMGIHGVTPEFIGEMRQIGFRDLRPRALVEMRIHRVSPEYVAEMREVGFRDLSPRELVEMRIHRISAAYVRELAELGYSGLERRDLLNMGIHGVTPAFIREMREAGFADLSADTLVRMKIHGIDADFVRSAERRRP